MSYTRPILVDGETPLNKDLFDIICDGIDESQKFDWKGKTIAFWGDSVTAAGNGDFTFPFSGSPTWPNLVSKYFRCAKSYVRGIGGQTYKWGSGGGSVSFIKENGNLHSRNDGYTYENYAGNVTVPDGCVAVRGCSCSYLRISKMFPESIRNDIDCVFVIFHNDGAASTKGQTVEWITDSQADPEWYASEYYATYGGDYNISTTAGGIISTVMKLQAVLPNAVIVIGTPVGGNGSTGLLNPDQSKGNEKKMIELRDLVKEVSAQFGIPCIDVFGTCGINGLNREQYIIDSIHPNKYGHSMMARSVIGGLKNIVPAVYTNRTPNNITGTATISTSTVEQMQQGIEGFIAGDTYEYTITPHYTGNLTVYYGYYDYRQSRGYSIVTSPTVRSGSCTAEVPITGTFTIPETMNTNGEPFSLIVLRTHQNTAVSVDYEFIRNN